jgi:hypothetical protein
MTKGHVPGGGAASNKVTERSVAHRQRLKVNATSWRCDVRPNARLARHAW